MKNFNKKIKVNIISVKTKNLKKNQILSICKLKNSYWYWTIPKQLKWFKKNVKKEDINNMMMFENRLIGYNLLRKRIAYVNNKPLKYIYFDSFVLDKRMRNKSLGKKLLLFNFKTLNRIKKHSFLICKKKQIPFYLQYGWKVLPKNRFKIVDHKSAWFKNKKEINGMIYNLDKKIKNKLYYYFNKHFY
tara:strand:+ start:159 stop:722 length:564 start_codon:yes stop_codon:yes gene_type:complete